MKSRHLPLLLAGAIAASLALSPHAVRADAAAGPAVTVDGGETSAHFSVTHLLLTKVTGQIPLKDATLAIDANLVPTSAKVTFDISKLATDNDQRDGDLKSDHWFDVANSPDMNFVSTKIVPGPKGTFTMDGNLTMHGVTKPVELAGALEGKVTDRRGRTLLGYSATGTIDRTQWNLGANVPPAIVATGVDITIALEAIEK